MGMQDRDYYKDAWNKRKRGDINGYHYGSSFDAFSSKNYKIKKYNPFWTFIFTVVFCAIIFVVLKIIIKTFT